MKSLHHVSKRTWKAFAVIQLGNGEILFSIHCKAIPAILGAGKGISDPIRLKKKKRKKNDQLRWVQPAVWESGRNSSKNSSGRGHLGHRGLSIVNIQPSLSSPIPVAHLCFAFRDVPHICSAPVELHGLYVGRCGYTRREVRAAHWSEAVSALIPLRVQISWQPLSVLLLCL